MSSISCLSRYSTASQDDQHRAQELEKDVSARPPDSADARFALAGRFAEDREGGGWVIPHTILPTFAYNNINQMVMAASSHVSGCGV